MSTSDDKRLQGFVTMMIATISPDIHVDIVETRPDGSIQAWTQAFGQPKLFTGRGAAESEATTALLADVTAFVGARSSHTAKEPLGMVASCSKCGGQNEWTGKERRSSWADPAFGRSARTRIVSGEISCKQCGHTEWTETGSETEGDV